MKGLKLKIIIVFVASSLAASASTGEQPNGIGISTPSDALLAFLKASRKGVTSTYLELLSDESRKLLVSGADFLGESLDEIIQEDPFESIEAVGTLQTNGTAAIQFKVRYKDTWFQMDGMNVSALSKEELSLLQDPEVHGHNISYHMPCAVQGVGFVTYLLVEEDGAWKVKKGLGYPIQLDIKKFIKE